MIASRVWTYHGDVVSSQNDRTVPSSRLTVPLASLTSASGGDLRVSVDGWQLAATDCSSSGGTALVPHGEVEPIRLEPPR